MQFSQLKKIDVHHHYFPSTLSSDKKDAAARLGWRPPAANLPWSPEVSLAFMDKAGIDMAILSFPGFPSNDSNKDLVSARNQEMAAICALHPTRFAFFASLPHLADTEGCLQVIAHSFDELHAQGVALPSSCGVGPDALYIADETFAPVWEELDRRRAVVHLHGTQTPSSTPYPGPFLGIPITEVPNETFKAAAHLVVNGYKRKYPNVKIILAHLGGSMPYLAARVAALSPYMGCPLTPDEIMEDFRSFYFDTALSASDTNLKMIEAFAGLDRVLYGSDFPGALIQKSYRAFGSIGDTAVPADTIQWFDDHLDAFSKEREGKETLILSAIHAENIARILQE